MKNSKWQDKVNFKVIRLSSNKTNEKNEKKYRLIYKKMLKYELVYTTKERRKNSNEKERKENVSYFNCCSHAIIAILWFATRGGNTEKQTETNQIVEEFVQVQEDGTKLNISNKLKEEKELDGLKFGNIQLSEKDGQLTLLANVTNTTSKDVDAFFVDIILYDKEGNEIDTILGLVSPVKAGETVELKAGITEDYSNAYDFKVVKK